ncbi:hypothetical protein FNAPI_4387 [Fusarium napiforme]|uniref:Uncharacterized protein n=1 Tax=Fusarium napiforme TaxID=42672 RepID=A0A8H5JR65_9HYPO|nr:hypothetical protein FNAPI_4387 [Fusarium napiforme]
MEYVTDDQVLKILSEFKKNKITLVEWETPLLQRLGYPLAPQSDLLFLVPDEQINDARHIASACGLRDDNKPPSYMAECAEKSYRYVYGESSHKFILVPISWTGIQQKELVVADLATLPCPLWTVPVPAFCAAYLRIIMRENAGSTVRSIAKADLASVIGYSMFDMSYEGDYMPTPEDLEHLDAAEKKKMAEKDALEMENALSSIKQWKFTEETEWARGMMLQLAHELGTFALSFTKLSQKLHYTTTNMPPLPANMREAAQAFSRILTDNNIEHAFIGGFALNILGSNRETLDIDVEVAMDHAKPTELRFCLVQLLREADQRFMISDLKLFFVPNGQDLRVPIETLARGMLGLPRRFSILRPVESVPILHPGVLILTKMKRSCQYIGSTRPQSVVKFNSDVRDIVYLLHWLQDHGKKIDFINYDAASPETLYDAVR